MNAPANLPILYTFRRCPYAMRARMAVAVSGVEVQQVEVALRQKPEALLQASPKGTVPVLVLPDGSVLEQSLDIMQWALVQNDPENWLQNNALASLLISENDGEFKVFLDKYKYANRHVELAPDAHRDNVLRFLQMLQTELIAHPFLHGAALSAVDIAIMPFVRQCAQVDRVWFSNTAGNALNTWLCSLEQSAIFETVMQKNEKSKVL